MIYLDNAATTKPYAIVLDAMRDVSENFYANPHSLHSFGVAAERKVTEARKIIADILNVQPAEIIFTAGGSEANNLAIRGIANLPDRLGKHIITTAIEHAAVLEPFRYLESIGFESTVLPIEARDTETLNQEQQIIKSPLYSPDYVSSAIRKDTRLLSIMLVNNETGSIQEVAEIAKLCKKRNPSLIIHVDAVQAFGKIPINIKNMGIDLMSFSAHKLNGPKGVGALYVRKGLQITPQILGGGQEFGLRSGTLNVPGIYGFALAARLRSELLNVNLLKVTRYKELLKKILVEALADDLFIISPESASPYILQVAFLKMKAEVMLHHLAEKEIYVSSGSACSARKKSASHAIKALNLHEKWHGGTIRFSFSAENTEEEIAYVAKTLIETYRKIRF